MKTSTFDTKFKRRREAKTNYKKRIAFVKSKKPRLVVRKTNKYVNVQIISFEKEGDKTIASANSKELKGLGWGFSFKNLPAAYLTGLLIGKRATEKKVEEAVLDIGFLSPVHGSIPFAVLKGAVDAGLKIPFEETALPKEERISGKHIQDFSKKEITKAFEEIKSKVLKAGKKGE